MVNLRGFKRLEVVQTKLTQIKFNVDRLCHNDCRCWFSQQLHNCSQSNRASSMHLSLFNCCLVVGLLSLIRSDVHPNDRVSDMTIERMLPHLAGYNISTITVSGLSAGGYMAVQLHVAHSIIISGAAVFAGVRISDCLSLTWLVSLLPLTCISHQYVGSVLLRRGTA